MIKQLSLLCIGLMSLSAFASNTAPSQPINSAQFWTTTVNAKTGKEGSFHKIWLDGDRARVEEYSNPTNTVINDVLLTDGQHGYMYSPRTKNATVFSGINTITSQAANFLTEANLKAAWGGVVKSLPDSVVKGINCRVYKVGGLMVWFNAESGFCVKYGSAREASTEGGTYYSKINIPADHADSLYTLPKDSKLKDPGFIPGTGGK